MEDAPWAIISEHGVVHRTDTVACLAITNAIRGKQKIKHVTVKQVKVYGLSGCHSCWPSSGSFLYAVTKEWIK